MATQRFQFGGGVMQAALEAHQGLAGRRHPGDQFFDLRHGYLIRPLSDYTGPPQRSLS